MKSNKLSRPQEDAVTYTDGLAVVTAGAGSGKTRVLTSKISYLVNELDYAPSRILAITFTNKAAEEMKNRLRIMTGRPISAFPWVRTFHSACFQILKAHCEVFGFEKPIIIHSDYQQDKSLKKALTEVNLDAKKYLRQVGSMISLAKNSSNPFSYIEGRKFLPKVKHTIYERYNELLRRQNAVDFDDILMLVRDLLRDNENIKEYYRNHFQYILVDEFQDSNGVQNEITNLLMKNGNLTVVGDDYQSIYMFRGADPTHFINFSKAQEGVKVFKLEENYRSTTQIVGAANVLIANNVVRLDKNCFSRREGELIQFNELSDDAEEAKWVALKCLEYHRKGTPYKEMSVLYRSKFCSYHFERAFRTYRVPYKMVGGLGFFQRKEIQDLNAYLISAINTKDNASFERIINIPSRKIGDTTIGKIMKGVSEETSLQQASRKASGACALASKVNIALRDLFAILDSIRELPPAKALTEVMDQTNYKEYLKGFCDSDEEYDSRLENVYQLIVIAGQHDTISGYLEDVALINEDKEDDDGKDEKVRLGTIHSAKGLEYTLVFVVAAEEKLLPHARAIEESADGIEEERRLMYVAMTRAADYLHITAASERRKEPALPTRFLSEIPAEYIKCHIRPPVKRETYYESSSRARRWA